MPDLLDSPESAPHFTVEVDNDGRPTVRFGDDEYGKRPVGATAFTAVYRIGNGRAGQCRRRSAGARRAAHGGAVVARHPENSQSAGGPGWHRCRDHRRGAPVRSGGIPRRAVPRRGRKPTTPPRPRSSPRWPARWRASAGPGAGTRSSSASIPRDPEDLITEPGGRTRLAPGLASRVRNFLTRYKLAGYDLEIRSAEYVPLEIAFELCVEPDHFRGDVVEAVRQALSNRVNADGSRGFFHPDNFTFAQNVYLSQIYAAIEAVQGVLSAFVTIFRRFGKTDNGELASGVLPIGPWEIARLDNDPAFQENGVLRITAGGGK